MCNRAYIKPQILGSGEVLDLIAGNNLIILATVPVGFAAADASGKILEPVLAGLQAGDVLRLLGSMAAERLDAEVAAAGSLTEALAMLLDERIRAGAMHFNELLVHFAISGPDGQLRHKLICGRSAIEAAGDMLHEADAFMDARAGAIAEDE